jgi:hypothetical protein
MRHALLFALAVLALLASCSKDKARTATYEVSCYYCYATMNVQYPYGFSQTVKGSIQIITMDSLVISGDDTTTVTYSVQQQVPSTWTRTVELENDEPAKLAVFMDISANDQPFARLTVNGAVIGTINLNDSVRYGSIH